MKAAPRPLRGALALWQVLLLVALQFVDGSGAHGCPAHDAAPARGATAAHAGHGATPGESHPHTGPCTCLGTCHSSTIAGAPSRPVVLFAAAVARVSRTSPAFAAPPRAAARLLPFALGPPTLA